MTENRAGPDNAIGFYDSQYIAGEYGSDELPEIFCKVQKLLERFQLLDGFILDIGAGKGAMQAIPSQYVALDVSFVALQKYTSDHKKVVALAEQLPFQSRSVNSIVSIATLEHIPSPDQVMDEIDRVLAPGGVAYLWPAWFCRPWAAEGIHVRKFTELTFRQKIVRLTIPMRNNLLFRALYTLPGRFLRLASYLMRPEPTRFRYRTLIPNYETYWGADSDAVCSLDSFEAILFYCSRGYSIISHTSWRKRLLARHEPVIVLKTCPVP